MAEIVEELQAKPKKEVGPGYRLAQARQVQGISKQHICEKLKLTLDTLNDLESDEFASGLPRAFFRGYIRSYANLLGLSADDLVKLFNEMHAVSDEKFDTPIDNTLRSQSLDTSKRTPYVHAKRYQSNIVWLITIMILLAIASTVFVFFRDVLSEQVSNIGFTTTSEKNLELQSLDIPEQEKIVRLDSDGNDLNKITASTEASTQLEQLENDKQPTEVGVIDLVADEELSATASQVQPALALDSEEKVITNDLPVPGFNSSNDESPKLETALEGQTTAPVQVNDNELKIMQMRFIAECWVKVTDDSEEHLVYGLKEPGRVIEVETNNTFKLTMGDPSAVEITINDEPVDLSAHVAGKTVHLTL
ncbi:MAG: RodZ domain-containing protein [Pseudomonadota bacterium]